MKFTKQQAFEKLKSELTQGGKSPRLSDRSINDYVDNLLEVEKDNEELELDAFVSRYKKALVSMNGNVEHDVSTSVNDFKTTWEKEHPSPIVPPATPPAVPPAEDPNKAILDRLKALEDENARIKSEKSISQKRADLKSKMKEKGIDNDDWAEGMLSQIAITEDLDIEAKAGELLTFYNKVVSNIPRQIVTPGAPGGPVDQRDSAIAQASARAEAKRKQEQEAFQN